MSMNRRDFLRWSAMAGAGTALSGVEALAFQVDTEINKLEGCSAYIGKRLKDGDGDYLNIEIDSALKNTLESLKQEFHDKISAGLEQESAFKKAVASLFAGGTGAAMGAITRRELKRNKPENYKPILAPTAVGVVTTTLVYGVEQAIITANTEGELDNRVINADEYIRGMMQFVRLQVQAEVQKVKVGQNSYDLNRLSENGPSTNITPLGRATENLLRKEMQDYMKRAGSF